MLPLPLTLPPLHFLPLQGLLGSVSTSSESSHGWEGSVWSGSTLPLPLPLPLHFLHGLEGSEETSSESSHGRAGSVWSGSTGHFAVVVVVVGTGRV